MVIGVIGAAGNVGRFVIDELVQHGHDVVAVDLKPPRSDKVDYRHGDIEDASSLVDALHGCSAVIHLAAIVEPGLKSAEVTFRVNALGTLHCLEAAVKVNATRFVLASSEAVTGLYYRERDFEPEYFPIDEDHPLQPQDCYGLSKLAAEEACRSYTRRGVLSTVCVRPCYCWDLAFSDEAMEVLRHPERHWRTLWGYIHARDVARAYRLACEQPEIEHLTFNAVASDSLSNVPTAELLKRFYPDVPLVQELATYGSIIANDQARRAIGFEPQLSWRDEIPADGLPASLEPALE